MGVLTRRAWFSIGLWACLVALSIRALLRGEFPPALALGSLVCAVLGAGMTVHAAVVGSARGPRVRALDEMARARFDEAEALLDTIPRIANHGTVRRSVLFLRAWTAFRRGAIRDAIELSTASLRVRVPWIDTFGDRTTQAGALALRALAEASAGDAAKAEGDIRAVRSHPCATANGLAEASLAQAMLLDRRRDVRALRELLQRERRLLLDMTGPHERGLARALMRKVEAADGHAYRRSTRRPVQERRDPAPPPSTDAKLPAMGVGGKSAALVLGAIGFAVIYVFSRKGTVPLGVGAPLDMAFLLGALMAALSLYLFVTKGLRQRSFGRAMLEASRSAGLEGWDAARRRYARLATLPAEWGARAEERLAAVYERSAAFEECLACCDRGLSRIAGARSRAHPVYAQLVARRAYALAALDRGDAARNELAVLERDCPRCFGLASMRFRVQLVLEVRAGNLEQAFAVACERTPDLPLDRYDETLADAVVALHDRSAVALEPIEGELADDPELRAWVRAVAPSVADAVLASSPGTGPEVP